MRIIDILVSFTADLQKESAVAERVIRSGYTVTGIEQDRLPPSNRKKNGRACAGRGRGTRVLRGLEKNGGVNFHESCHDHQDLEEFADLFRQYFLDFLVSQAGTRV